MLPRKRLALTLVAAGALACTTVSAPPSFAADAHEAEAASNTGVSLDEQQTVIVQLEDGADREGVRQRIDQAVAAATPGASTEYVRDYHHVFEGFAVKAPSSALAAIKGVQGVQAVVSDGVREPIVYPEIVGRASDEIDDPSALTHADQASERGQGRVIEVIDSGFDTSHEAFSGALDAASLRVTQADMAALTTQLGAGRAGAWLPLPAPTGQRIEVARPALSSSSPRSSPIPGTSFAIVLCWRPWTTRWCSSLTPWSSLSWRLAR